MLRVFTLLCLMLCSVAAQAFEEKKFNNPQDESLFKDLVAELRCLVCQNQNIADSNAELAVDLRREIHSMINAGKSKAEILDFMVDRYGEFVLYKPRFSARTLVLWLAPAFLLLLGLLVIFRRSAAARKTAPAPDEAALARARSILDNKD